MKSFLLTILQLIVFTNLFLLVPIKAEESPLLSHSSSSITFVEAEIFATPGETVEICLERNTYPIFPGYGTAEIVAKSETSIHSPFDEELKLTFLPGLSKVCYDFLIIDDESRGIYKLRILGGDEEIDLHINDEDKEAWCGAIPQITSVSPEDAIAMDNFGNYYSPELLTIPSNPGSFTDNTNTTAPNCGCNQLGFNLSVFEPYFEDCIYETGMGFDDQSLGDSRREVICAALQYLEVLIIPNQSVCKPGEQKRVNIRILPSNVPTNYPLNLDTIPPNVLGYATPLYSTRPFYVGIRHSWAWEIINSGEYPSPPVDINMYHSEARFNFMSFNFDWYLGYTDDNISEDELDFYTVALHELTHSIGFVSAFNSIVGEIGSREGLGVYNNMDQYLQIEYDNLVAPLNLIETGASENSYPFSHLWFFNDDVDGLGINDDLDPNDLHSSCPGPGPHITFKGQVANHPVFTGAEFLQGSSFSHLDGRCDPSPGTNFREYVMLPSLGDGETRRLFQWQELDVLRTMGYNIDCTVADFLDDNPTDTLTFDCNQADEACTIASVNDLSEDLEECEQIKTMLTFPTCPGDSAVRISIQDLEELLLTNDPNATAIAFINPLFSEAIGNWEMESDSFMLSTQSWGNFLFSYAPIACNGGVSNVSTFSIGTFPGSNCGIPSCEFLTCETSEIPEGWEYCENFENCEENFCDFNLVCNGGFCGAIIVEELSDIFNPTTGPLNPQIAQNYGANIIPPTGWILGDDSVDFIVSGDAEDLPAVVLVTAFPSVQDVNDLGPESIFTYLKSSPVQGQNYLCSADFLSIIPWAPDVFGFPGTVNARLHLFQGQSYTPCGLFGYCYDPNAPIQTILATSDVIYPEGSHVRLGNCFTVEDGFNALLISGTPNVPNLGPLGSYEGVDNVELIPDDFSAGVDLISEICGQTQSLGGQAFCMLTDVHVQYDWYELGSTESLHTFDILNGMVTGDTTFQVNPNQTTTYQLERTILDLGGLTDDFEFCTSVDEVTITVLEQLPIANFNEQLVEGECGMYNYFSDPTTIGNEHRWYLDEQTEDAIFSTEISPTNHQLPNGTHTIIHVVEGVCGTTEAEIIIEVNDCVVLTCPCEGVNSINIDAGEGTLLSQLISNGEMPTDGINNQCLAIGGHLRIDMAATGSEGFYTIELSEVKMQPGSSIIVEAGAGLSINNNVGDNGLHGCEALWKGISLLSGPPNIGGGRLILNTSIIEDAVYAVELGHTSSFEMQNSTLNRNHIGLYMASSPTGQEVIQPTFPQNSIISSTANLLPAYPDQEVETGIYSYAGVELNDCKNFQIGGGKYGIEITDANYGVIAHHSAVQIFESRIHNMVADPGDIFSNTGVLADDISWITLRNSRLHDLQYGVYGNNTSIYARNNIIGEDLSGNRGNIEQGISLIMDVGNVGQITDQNQIYAQSFGIVTNNTHEANSLFITGNTIELLPPNLGVPNTDGIRLADALMSGENENLRIENNVINLHQGGSGISLFNVNGTSVIENYVNFLSTHNSINFGLILRQASNNYVSDNTITGTGPSSLQGGINVFEGDENVLCCNSVMGTYFGIQFSGFCDDTKLRHTTFEGNSIGLQCNSNTRIGQQSAGGNMWDESLIWQARHQSVNEFDVNNSLFFVDSLPGSIIWPGNVSVASGTQWFFSGPVAPLCLIDTIECEQPGLDQLAVTNDFAQELLQGDFLYGSYPETSDWEAKRVFYRSQRATKEEDRLDWPVENRSFFDQQTQENSTLYQLTQIEQSLEEALTADLLVSEAKITIESLTEQLFNLDQVFTPDEDPSNEYLASRAGLLEQLDSAFDYYSNLLDQKQNDYLTLISQLRQDNSFISTSIEAASAMKTVNYWYLENMAEGLEKLSNATETALREMAERCPQRYGSAVGRSQAILVRYDKSFTPSTECKEEEEARPSSNSDLDELDHSKRRLRVEDIVVYPNPAYEVLTIQFPTEINETSWSIELFDTRGRILRSQSLQGNLLNLNVALYPAGVYWVRVQAEGTSINKRIIIQ